MRWLEAALPQARAAFSSRAGGVSAGAFESLNLGIDAGDEPGSVVENRRRLCAALDLSPERIATGRQVHGTGLASHDAPPGPGFAAAAGAIPEVDGHVTAEPGLVALVFAADCLPVALAGPSGVAMLHCGWRGLAGGIVARGVEAVGATHAAIGPGVGPCCYEVGDDVLGAFSGLDEGVTSGHALDLAALARRMLRVAGVEEIESATLCTSCEDDLFFSHRRDAGRTGRQAGLVWLEDPDGKGR